jgi:putative heme iron utilization protein
MVLRSPPMSEKKIDPIRPTDDAARALARNLIDGARTGALAVRDPDHGAPMVSRVAVATDAEGRPVSLISDLSHHTRALDADPVCSLLLGEPGRKGDPLTHPRITLLCRARRVRHGDAGHGALRDRYLAAQPKAKLYIDFADFGFAVFEVTEAHLNGGFGKAYRLTPEDLARPR